MNYGFCGSVMTATNAKASAQSEKFNLKIRSESGKLLTIGCHFPLKSTNFGTMTHSSQSGSSAKRVKGHRSKDRVTTKILTDVTTAAT